MTPRLAAKVDANQAAIVQALRTLGCSVQSLAAQGSGVPDLLVGIRGKNYLVEVKDGAKAPSARKLTQDQVAWHAAWQGHPVDIIETVEGSILWATERGGTV
jgi:hypothetical protein